MNPEQTQDRRDRTEAASLEETLLRMQLLLNSTMDAVICMDQQGKVLLWNSRAEFIFGYTADQAVGRTVAELIVPPEYRERHRQGMAHFMETGAPQIIGTRVEVTGMRADGSQFPIELTIGSMADNGPRLFSAFVRDITQRKSTEAQLFKLSQAVEQSPESIVITDLDGRIEYVNPAFVLNTGFSSEEVIGRNPRILHSGKTPPETFVTMWRTLVGGATWKGEFRNKRKDGSEYVELAIITPIRQPDGRTTHYVAIKEDITEKKLISWELEQHRHHLEDLVASRTKQLEEAQQQAEAANRAKSNFLAKMSHEIRTPMNAIIGLTHLLRHTTLTPEQTDKLDKITVATEHLLWIVNDILDLSNIQTGKLTLESSDFDLAAMFDYTRSLIAEPAYLKGLEIIVDTDGVPPWLRGDETRLRQALINFASNAVKFTKRGSITLRARIVEENGDELKIRFEVEDTGIGIPAEQLVSLFHSFVQADDSNTRKYGGTGLGLAISRHLANMMGGDAGADSEVGRGSTFWFTACLQRGHDKQIPPIELEADSAERGREALAQSPLPATSTVENQPAKEDELLQRLATISDLDLEAGLAMIRGNVEKYTRLLGIFVDSNQSHIDRIGALAAAGDLAMMESIAHSLKGSASMLGAVNLAEAARSVLSAIRSRASTDSIPLLSANLTKALASLIDGIRLAMAGDLGPVASEVDSARLAQVLVQLEDLLRQGDMAAGKLARQEADLLRHAFGNAADRLLALIEAFDFENAAAELHAYHSRRTSSSMPNRAG
jgi:PAS domain S-box-containing protein